MAEPIKENSTGSCPHCGTGVRFVGARAGTPAGWFDDPAIDETSMQIVTVVCPACDRPIVALQVYQHVRLLGGRGSHQLGYSSTKLIWPPSISRKPLPTGVPPHICEDYLEAAIVMPDSEKASAALSRRCLQSVLREVAQAKSRDLADQIEEVLPNLPGYLQKELDAVRNIGNFAAHPQKSKVTGEIVDVEPGEAEWNLDVLDMLFDFYYEQPKIAQQKRDALNKKLTEIGKPPMK